MLLNELFLVSVQSCDVLCVWKKVLTYVAEIAQPKLRGLLASTSTLTIYFGIFTQFLMGTFLYWRTVALINISVQILAVALLFLIPESPYWLISKDRMEDAKKSLAWLRGWTTEQNVEMEFQELCKACVKTPGTNNFAMEQGLVVSRRFGIPKSTKTDYLKRFGTRDFYVPYILVSICFFLSHFTGVTPLQTFAVQIFQTLKAPLDKYYATMILGITTILGALTCSIAIHYTGKRPLAFFSTIGSGICFLTVATYAYLAEVNFLVTGNTLGNSTIHTSTHNSSGIDLESLHWLPTTLLIISAFIAHSGIRSLPWVLTSEVFPTDLRCFASGMASGIAYVFGFAANKTFLTMVSSLTLSGTFWFYGAVSLVGSVVLYFILPETEGRSLIEIENHFSGKCKLGKSMGKKVESVGKGEVNLGFSENGTSGNSSFQL